jgi:hypothetical protein
MGKTYIIRINCTPRTWVPKKRSETFADKREKRQKTRQKQTAHAINEYSEWKKQYDK